MTLIISFLLFISWQPIHCLSGTFFMLTYITPNLLRVSLLLFASVFLIVFFIFLVAFRFLLLFLIILRGRVAVLESHLLEEPHFPGLGFTLNINLKARKPCGQSRVLALLANGKGQLVIRHNNTCHFFIRICHNRDHLCRT